MANKKTDPFQCNFNDKLKLQYQTTLKSFPKKPNEFVQIRGGREKLKNCIEEVLKGRLPKHELEDVINTILKLYFRESSNESIFLY